MTEEKNELTQPCSEVENDVQRDYQRFNKSAILRMTWKEIAEALWALLDDIDTASDMVKDNNNAYRKMVEAIQKKRVLYLESKDGYTLTPVVQIKESSVGAALDLLSDTMLKDEEYRYSWQANIAMALHDATPNGMNYEERNGLANAVLARLFNV